MKQEFKAGNYKENSFENKKYKSFIPEEINKMFHWGGEKTPLLLEEVNRFLGELNTYSHFVPDVDFFIQMHVTNEAVKSSKIEGTKTQISDAVLPEKAISSEKRDDWQEVQNYIEAMNYSIDRLEDLPVSLRLIKEIHKILMQDVRGEDKRPGKIRETQNRIGGIDFETAAFVPPHPDEISDLLSDLELFWHNDSLRIPVLVKIAIFHYQFETIHPFLDGNGRVGRLLINLQLMERGILDKPTFYISDFFERNREDYYQSLMDVRRNNDINQWINFFLIAAKETAKKSRTTFEEIVDLRKEYERKIMKFGSQTELANQVLLHLFSDPAIEAKEIADDFDIAYNTANKLISRFEQAGILEEVTGKKRNRIFVMRDYLRLFDK